MCAIVGNLPEARPYGGEILMNGSWRRVAVMGWWPAKELVTRALAHALDLDRERSRLSFHVPGNCS
jgi:hypothetical protein